MGSAVIQQPVECRIGFPTRFYVVQICLRATDTTHCILRKCQSTGCFMSVESIMPFLWSQLQKQPLKSENSKVLGEELATVEEQEDAKAW